MTGPGVPVLPAVKNSSISPMETDVLSWRGV
jgi:hypothetical protein